MSLLSTYNLRYESAAEAQELRKRITAAVALAAIEAIREPVNVNSHNRRSEWARTILTDRAATEREAERMMWAVIAHPTLTRGNEASDTDIQTVVNLLVNAFAGV